jgi:asparagine synthase (glutamine-hydrolysing)
MCGLVGFLVCTTGMEDDEAQRQLSDRALLRQMADTLTHRGPEEGGTWVDADAGVALGH